MRLLQGAALTLLVNLSALSPVAASDFSPETPEARLSWRLGFGGTGAIRTGVGLALGYRIDGLESLATLADVDVTDRIALARLAGLPVLRRPFRTNAEGDEPIDEEPIHGTEPGNAHWGWWAAAGVAALVVAGAAGNAAEDHGGDGPKTPGTTGVTKNDDGVYVGCVEGTCAVCPDGSPAEHCGEGFVAWAIPRGYSANDLAAARLDAGTGGMGDLIARDGGPEILP
jgi:hypothetical protein